MFEKLLQTLVDQNSTRANVNFGDNLLNSTKEMYGLKHVAYLGANLPAPTHENFYVHNTYSDKWHEHYQTRNYIQIDPITNLGLDNMLPLNWRSLRDLTDEQRDFFGESSDFGVGKQGMSFSVRGSLGEVALFAVNSDDTDREWDRKCKHYMREFRLLADYFHAQVLTSLGNKAPTSVPLSLRESEILKWCAAGKTYWEISKILSVSESTISFHMANTISKLGCFSQTQAVVKAMRSGLI